ncbi:MAG: hypothetical protein H6730_19740 [Deltaproteobacteria bacterium]|nr:hypothetical protein [Deltaproteobacteria bacterium]
MAQDMLGQLGGAQDAGAAGEGDPNQQLLAQIQGAQSLDELQQVLQQAGVDPQQLPPQVQQAVQAKAAQLGA